MSATLCPGSRGKLTLDRAFTDLALPSAYGSRMYQPDPDRAEVDAIIASFPGLVEIVSADEPDDTDEPGVIY